MKYKVIILPEAQDDIDKLELTQKDKLQTDYKTVQEIDINAVNVNSLGNKLFEIKTNELRSIYEYRKGQIVVIAVVFIKKSQKTDEKYIKRAKKILEKHKEL
jgi:mRNA-degrading endonuclease RelE of RelBE toxin-antitoxin system